MSVDEIKLAAIGWHGMVAERCVRNRYRRYDVTGNTQHHIIKGCKRTADDDAQLTQHIDTHTYTVFVVLGLRQKHLGVLLLIKIILCSSALLSRLLRLVSKNLLITRRRPHVHHTPRQGSQLHCCNKLSIMFSGNDDCACLTFSYRYTSFTPSNFHMRAVGV